LLGGRFPAYSGGQLTAYQLLSQHLLGPVFITCQEMLSHQPLSASGCGDCLAAARVVVLGAVAVFAGASYGVLMMRQTGLKAPDTITVDGQPVPLGPPSYSRAIMESLAFKYRTVLEALEEITGRRFEQIRVVGGGARNRLLNQFTADATGRTVVAGPVEATALGNVAIQMLATGAVSSLAEARAIIDRSFPVERFEPVDTDRWDPHYRRFRDFVELSFV
jgi:sugar (pentulose or hexulose) kinase